MRGSRVAVIGHGALTFDLPIPCEVFGLDRSDIASPCYEFRLVAAEPGPVRTSTGFTTEAALAAGTDPDATPLERFEQYWIRVLDTFASHRRVWAATFEIFGHLERVPKFRRFVGDALQDARPGPSCCPTSMPRPTRKRPWPSDRSTRHCSPAF
jgi:hypothetical protein